jgi:histidine kinase
MNALISDLIRIAELDQAGFSSLRKTVELSAVIDDAIGQLRTQMQEKRIVMRVDLPSQLPELNTDRDALQQILHHLLQNADSATPPEGTITLRAVVDSQPEFGEFVLLQVSDTGGGISDVDLPRVFSRMYRNTNPLIKGIGDTGVGLTIAETLTQALGGRIWVESEQGVGATFSVLLPLQPQKANLIAEKQPG